MFPPTTPMLRSVGEPGLRVCRSLRISEETVFRISGRGKHALDMAAGTQYKLAFAAQEMGGLVTCPPGRDMIGETGHPIGIAVDFG